MGMPPAQGIEWWPGLVGRNGSEWLQRDKNWNPPTRGYEWWPKLAGPDGSEWPQRNKIGIPQSWATNGGRDWPGVMAANGLSARKNYALAQGIDRPWHDMQHSKMRMEDESEKEP
jgi:hypothetical protein